MNNISVLKKIFPMPPNNNYIGLNYDEEGLYSITYPKDADQISLSIIEILGTKDIYIIDLTAGCGGNMISFMKYFTKVTGVEINNNRYNILKANLAKYSFNNYELICGDTTQLELNDYDVFFIDPPWGGPDYKKNISVELYLSDLKLEDFIIKLPKNKLIVLKLPFNYNINNLNKFHIIKQYLIHNILIIFINIK